MSAEKVAERTEFLLQFLDLPTKWRLIQNLSGGQQRSVEVNRLGLKISTNEKALFHQRIPLIVQYISKIRKKKLTPPLAPYPSSKISDSARAIAPLLFVPNTYLL